MGDKPFTGASWLWMGQAILSAVIPMPCPLSWTRQRNSVVAIFGDSISHGGGSISYSPTDWDFSYASYLMFPTINLAQSGDTSAMGVERFDRDVLPFKPSYVIILIGSNSLRAGVPAGEVISDLQTLKEKCLSHGIKPVFLTIPPLNPENIKLPSTRIRPMTGAAPLPKSTTTSTRRSISTSRRAWPTAAANSRPNWPWTDSISTRRAKNDGCRHQ